MQTRVKWAAGTMVSAALGMTAWMAIVPANAGAG
jgi:hypothetical protein